MATLEECIGNTPLVALSRIGAQVPGVQLLAKLEGNNPAGSVKDRAAYSMFMGALASGRLREGVRIIEPTSGNTGIALAMMAARLQIPITLVMPESMSMERRAVMAAYGAELELTADATGMEGAIDRAWEMVRAGQGIMFDQFSNDDNWKAHYRSTGPEIWRDTEGQVSHFVSSMGTTGTIMGVSRYLKEQNPQVQIVGVHPEEGSKIPGIRRWPQEYLPKIFDASRVDRIMDVSATVAREMTIRLAREEGIFAGHSAGGATAAALALAGELRSGGCVVVILPDRGDRYVSTELFA